MAKIIYGEGVGKQGQLAIGCSAWVFDAAHQSVLLVQRADDLRWAVPGGYMESGESVTTACEREVLEETGLHVKISRLIAIYNNPHMLLEYPDGNKWQLVVLHFMAEKTGGSLRAGDETKAVNFFSKEESAHLNLGPFDRQRVADGFNFQGPAMIRNDLRI